MSPGYVLRAVLVHANMRCFGGRGYDIPFQITRCQAARRGRGLPAGLLLTMVVLLLAALKCPVRIKRGEVADGLNQIPNSENVTCRYCIIHN